MPSFAVRTPHCEYQAHVERGITERVAAFLPPDLSRIFVVTTEEVWHHQGTALEAGLRGVPFTRLLLPSGEKYKRMAEVERLAGEMVEAGADRQSAVVAFGGGVVTDMAGFLAAIFMRGIPVVQIPTTLLAQVDAAVGGKTGANLVNGKNLVGCFHQPHAVLIDPAAVDTLPEREYRAGLYEVIKHGVIASEPLFRLMQHGHQGVLAREPEAVDRMIAESVGIKAHVVTVDERETGLRKILNFGHTFGHALEAETSYTRFLHGEAVGWGMCAATLLAMRRGMLSAEGSEILDTVASYGPIPALTGISASALERRLIADKKARHGTVHFVLPVRIGEVHVVKDVSQAEALSAIEEAML
jgi:3-dehydroquinate synthase